MPRWILASLAIALLSCGNKDAGDSAVVDTSIFDATIPTDAPGVPIYYDIVLQRGDVELSELEVFVG